eukprot:3276854-Heterocapsa_arctica.AAC.1
MIHPQHGRKRVLWAFLLWSEDPWWWALDCIRGHMDVLTGPVPFFLGILSLPLHLILLRLGRRRCPRPRLCRRRG